NLLIGGDQREAKADVGLSAEIRGTWYGGTPPGFFLQRRSRGAGPDERRWRGPFFSGRAAGGRLFVGAHPWGDAPGQGRGGGRGAKGGGVSRSGYRPMPMAFCNPRRTSGGWP